MTEIPTFGDRSTRKLTYEERVSRDRLVATGVVDVTNPIELAPDEFWNAVAQALSWHVLDLETDSIRTKMPADWCKEVRWTLGDAPGTMYSRRDFLTSITSEPVHRRLALIELLLDDCGYDRDFSDRFADAARRWRVGIRLDQGRFIGVASEEIDSKVVRPALLLLREPKFENADAAYRKAWDRLLAGDAAGAITAATTAVEETLRCLGFDGAVLADLLKKARAAGLVTPGGQQLIEKLYAFREESDAHTVGTQDDRAAYLILHVAGAFILFLGSSKSPD